MLDHMSGGRLEIGFAGGSVPFEISYYGQNADERQQIYAERLELILKAFAARTLTWHRHYDASTTRRWNLRRCSSRTRRCGTEHTRRTARNARPRSRRP
jgi:alkanesulfonate monooxygenase SsuD/methylene tetrahydromethanopterin reductase-like flavin-dependent oxidoreductase (luciferase family)